MANPKGLVIGGVLLLSVGITLFIISLVLFPSVLEKVSNKAVLSNLVVDSTSSSRYNDWLGAASQENSYIQYYYMWNLTNPEQVIGGATPIIELVGPVNYQYQWQYLNVSFPDNGNQATYSQQKFYIYQEDGSVDPFNTMITNVNPAFWGLMSQLSVAAEEISNQMHGVLTVTAEELLCIVGTGGQMKLFLEMIQSPQSNFTELAYFYNSPKTFTVAFNTLLDNLGPDSENQYFAQWANATEVPAKPAVLWEGMILGQQSNITLESAVQIFNLTNPNSILHANALDVWLSACFGDDTQAQVLMTGLNINLGQMDMVCSWWMEGFSPVYTNPLLFSLCNVSSMDDVAICQYLTGKPLGFKSMASFKYTQQAFHLGAFEMAVVMNSNFSISSSEVYEKLFTGNYTLFTANNMGLFLNPSNSSLWGLSTADYTIVQEYILTMSQTYTQNTIFKQFYPISGFTATRSFYDWMWNCSDPLLDFLGQGVDCSLQQNNTIENPSTVYTGKSSGALMNQYVNYQGYTVVPYWNGTVEVEGVTESGQFAPGSSPPTLTLFEENTLRPINLVYVEDSSVQDVPTKRYFLQNNSFPASPVFYSPVDGLTNMSSTLNPPTNIFISLWDMYEVPESVSSKVIGQSPSYELSSIPLDLEPVSGNALYYNLKLQINFYIPDDPLIFQAGTTLQNTTSDVYYPIFKVGQTGTPSSSTIDTLKSQFKDLKILKLAPVIIAAIVGGILMIIGAIMTYFGVRRLRKLTGYTQINS